MPDVWVTAGIAAALLLTAGVVLRARRNGEAVTFEDEREERLAGRLARVVGSTPAQALPAIRKELRIAPGQSDETLVKRAAYHYRQDLPDAPCPVYRDRAVG